MRGSGSGSSSPKSLVGQPGHQPVDHADDVFGVDERHFHVELRELRLPVGPQVFVAEAAGDLHIAVVAGDHQNLLVELRRLRQRVKRAVMNAAGNEIVAGSLGRAAAEHRRFDVDESRARRNTSRMPRMIRCRSSSVCCISGAAQIEIAILEPQILVGQILAAGLQRRSQALVEHFEPIGPDLDLAGRQLGVDAFLPGRRATRPVDADHEFAAQRAGQSRLAGPHSGPNDDLGLAVAVAQIDEQGAAMIAVAVDPAAEGDRLADVRRPAIRRRYECVASESILIAMSVFLKAVRSWAPQPARIEPTILDCQPHSAKVPFGGRQVARAISHRVRRRPLCSERACSVHAARGTTTMRSPRHAMTRATEEAAIFAARREDSLGGRFATFVIPLLPAADFFAGGRRYRFVVRGTSILANQFGQAIERRAQCRADRPAAR